MLWIVLAAVAVFYLLVCVVMYVAQPRMIYFPSPTMTVTPQDASLPFEDVTLTCDDGVRIHAWFIPADSARATVIFCHGNGGNISHRLESIDQFHRLGLSVLIFDYHGYGESEGKPGERETYEDADAAWNYLTETRGISPDSIIIFGRSLGGGVAVWLAAHHQPKALVVESSFTSIVDVAVHYYPFLPVRLLARVEYNSQKLIGQIKAPVLIIHSPDDDIIPFKLGKKLFESANEPKQFLRIHGRHNAGYLESDDVYMKGWREFLTRIES
jgi:uncharacterized protein